MLRNVVDVLLVKPMLRNHIALSKTFFSSAEGQTNLKSGVSRVAMSFLIKWRAGARLGSLTGTFVCYNPNVFE